MPRTPDSVLSSVSATLSSVWQTSAASELRDYKTLSTRSVLPISLPSPSFALRRLGLNIRVSTRRSSVPSQQISLVGSTPRSKSWRDCWMRWIGLGPGSRKRLRVWTGRVGSQRSATRGCARWQMAGRPLQDSASPLLQAGRSGRLPYLSSLLRRLIAKSKRTTRSEAQHTR